MSKNTKVEGIRAALAAVRGHPAAEKKIRALLAAETKAEQAAVKRVLRRAKNEPGFADELAKVGIYL